MMINVNINTFSLVKYPQDLIVGEVYFSFKDIVFPKIKKEKWSDFIVWVLIDWNQAFEKIKNNSDETTFQLSFFDGPFEADVVNKNGLLKFQFVQTKQGTIISMTECECDLIEFEKSLKAATKELLIELKKRNWISKHTEELSDYHTA
ncbi:hypothetical protein ACFTQ7_03810 [Lysinibacillus sp. NPDC056959]|uniref:hypothetical protein n=1 Tax=Lysinibacillus sp. NPDC056959 TaxID=3345981 RepID=UPI00363AF364